MSIQILIDNNTGAQCLYCTTTDWAFGPIFTEDEEPQEFLEWLGVDARSLSDSALGMKVIDWRTAPTEMYCEECHHASTEMKDTEYGIAECPECGYIMEARKAQPAQKVVA